MTGAGFTLLLLASMPSLAQSPDPLFSQADRNTLAPHQALNPRPWLYTQSIDLVAPPSPFTAAMTTARASVDDVYWDARFALAGVNGFINAVAVYGPDVYVAGSFTAADGQPLSRIARWDGTAWHALGNGLNGVVHALAIEGTTLYAAGEFTIAGSITANHIAAWNITTEMWSALGSGLQGGAPYTNAYALAVDTSGDVYVGGYFTSAGGVATTCIAKWNGTAWQALGTGLSSAVYTLATNGTTVYAGGRFLEAGGLTVNRIAQWNGTWSNLGTGINDEVYALAVIGGTLYAGGKFSNAGGSAANYLAQWNGATWSTLSSGTDGPVYDLFGTTDGRLYTGGKFTTAGGTSATNIALWESNTWNALGTGVDAASAFAGVYAMDLMPASATGSEQVFAAGSFTRAGTQQASRIAAWDATTWKALRLQEYQGTDGAVRALTKSGNTVYAGGYFLSAGGADAGRVAQWHNTNGWTPLGTGMYNGAVLTLALDGSTLYAAGTFTRTGNNAVVNRVARWNGSGWTGFGTGLSGGDFPAVYALASDGSGKFYAGGTFSDADGIAVSNIAYWNGSAWLDMSGGVEGGSVLALAVLGSHLYVGGTFARVGGQFIPYIAKWNPVIGWSAVGDGANGPVHALKADGSNLYVGGSFTQVDNKAANRIAIYNTTTGWAAMGTGFNGDAVSTLDVQGGKVYAGGSFTTANGSSANRVAVWESNTWNTFGSGTDGPITAIAATGTEVYVGGYFGQAGSKPASHFARYSTDNVISSCTFAPGWNLLSVPYMTNNPGDMTPGTWVPSAISSVFSFNPITGYQAETTLANGLGYWALFSQTVTENIEALSPVATRTVAVQTGWNMIGGFDAPINVATITPTSIIGSGFFAFTDRYLTRTTLDPCRGYWVLATQNGLLDLSGTTAAGKNSGITGSFPTQPNPRWPQVRIQDAAGRGQTLYFPPADVPVRGFALPPLAPGLNFDIRFSTDRYAEYLTDEPLSLRLHNVRYPITLMPMHLGEGTISLETTDGTPLSDELGDADTWIRNEQLGSLRIRLQTTPTGTEQAEVPQQVALLQNYPNPFQTQTALRYALPATTPVRLTLYNTLGQHVRTLVDQTIQPAGYYTVPLNASTLPSGTYFYRLEAGPTVHIKKMTLIR